MLASTLLAAWLVAPAPAGPAPPPRPLREVLRLDAGATCLDAPALAETIQSWLGRETIDPVVTRIEVRGDSTRADAVAITVELRGELVERSFDPAPAACGELHAVVGLAIAIAVDTSVLEGLGYEVVAPGEASAPQAYDPERPPLQRRRRGEAPTPARSRRAVRLAVALRGGAWFGVLPGMTGGGAAHLELSWARRVDLRLGMWGGYAGGRVLDARSSVDLGLFGGRLDACLALQRRRVRPRLCFGPAVGALQVLGDGVGVRSAVGPWAALTLAPELRVWATQSFALDLFVDLVVPFVRPVLAERDPNKAGMIGNSLASPPVGAVLGLGAAFAIR